MQLGQRNNMVREMEVITKEKAFWGSRGSLVDVEQSEGVVFGGRQANLKEVVYHDR